MKKIVLLIMMLLSSSVGRASTTIVDNMPPAISISSPENDSTYTAGSSIIITAAASEAEGTVSSVSFYNGLTLLGHRKKFPYTYTWENVPVGTYILTAVATADGVSSTSSAITVIVTAASPSPPEVDITSPANGTTFTAGSDISLAATASELNGTIATVGFYNGSTLLATTSSMTSSLCNYTWTDVPAGVYTLTAKAIDVNGVSTTSSPIIVKVKSSSTPDIAITSPINQSTFIAGSNIPINATFSEAKGTIREVYFFDRSYYLGSTTVSPYVYTWTNVPAGTYSLTVEATDSNGNTLVSAPVDITVIPVPAPSAPLGVNTTSLANAMNK